LCARFEREGGHWQGRRSRFHPEHLIFPVLLPLPILPIPRVVLPCLLFILLLHYRLLLSAVLQKELADGGEAGTGKGKSCMAATSHLVHVRFVSQQLADDLQVTAIACIHQ